MSTCTAKYLLFVHSMCIINTLRRDWRSSMTLSHELSCHDLSREFLQNDLLSLFEAFAQRRLEFSTCKWRSRIWLADLAIANQLVHRCKWRSRISRTPTKWSSRISLAHIRISRGYPGPMFILTFGCAGVIPPPIYWAPSWASMEYLSVCVCVRLWVLRVSKVVFEKLEKRFLKVRS